MAELNAVDCDVSLDENACREIEESGWPNEKGIKRYRNAITPGRWFWWFKFGGEIKVQSNEAQGGTGEIVCDVLTSSADAQFIAFAPEAIDFLLDRLTEARAEITRLQSKESSALEGAED